MTAWLQSSTKESKACIGFKKREPFCKATAKGCVAEERGTRTDDNGIANEGEHNYKYA
jgi:hypothetical protein